MKKIGVKKLAAIAAGAALLGTAIAPFATAAVSDLSKSDIYSASGSPLVQVVVGSTAKASDVIWAGNIASKIAEKAVMERTIEKTVTGGEADTSAAEVTISVGGTKTVTGAQTFQDTMNSISGATEGQFKDQNVTNGTVPSLKYYADKSYTWAGSSYTTTMQEKLNFTADVMFDSLTAKALVASIPAGNMKYLVDLGTGIPLYESTTSGTAFSDGANDNVRIPFLGEDYLVKSVSLTGTTANQVELVKSTAEKEYLEGEKITGLKGKDGADYEILVGAGATYGSTDKVNLSLLDSEGNKAATDVQVASGEDVTFYDDAGNSVLATSVSLSTLGKTTTNNTTVFKPFFLIGNDRLLLKNANGYPYDPVLKASDYDYWTTLVTDGNYVKRIEIATREPLQKTGSNALKAGEEVAFMNDYATLEFVGLQTPEFADASRTERTTGITIGNGKLTFKDPTNEITQDLPFVIGDTTSLSQSGSSALSSLGTIAGQTVYARVSSTTDQDINLSDGGGTGGGAVNSLNGITLDVAVPATDKGKIVVCYTEPRTSAAVCDTNADGAINIGGMNFRVSGVSVGNDTNALTWVQLKAGGVLNLSYGSTDSATSDQNFTPSMLFYPDDQNTAFTSGVQVKPQGSTTWTYRYTPVIKEVSSSTIYVMLMLSGQDISTQYSKTISVLGTDVDEDKRVDAAYTATPGPIFARYPYYLLHTTATPATFGGDTNYTADNIFVAQFGVNDDEEAGIDYNVAVNTTNGQLIRVGTGSNLSNYTAEVVYDKNQVNKVAYSLSTQQTGLYASTGYSEFGSKAALDSTSTQVTFTIPENVAKAEIKISGSGTVETTTGGEEITVKKGEVGTTTSGTKITVNDITGVTVSGGEGGETETETVYERASLNGKAKVVLDNTDPGAAILVGGQKVNKLTRALGAAISDQLDMPGKYVVEKVGDKIVVAGYTKDDTGTAANALIAWLEAQ